MPVNIKTNAIAVKNGQEFDNVDAFFLGDIRGEVGDWMAEHSGEIRQGGYVMPEDYGAVGDGITDDTLAWQVALDSGKNVHAAGKKYKVGTLTVTKSIAIDCNNADFICTAGKLFDIYGVEKATLDGESDYAANDVGYLITSGAYSNYSGFAMLKGTNHFEESRLYYYGGFVCTFHDGKMNGSYPIDVEETKIIIVEPVSVHLKNIGNISFSGVSHTDSIKITYGFNCVIENINAHEMPSYNFISLLNCLSCVCKNIRLIGEYGTVGTNSYVISFDNSCYCAVKDSYIYNKYWHCITTGANYLCYRNMVDNCVLITETQAAYDDHENGIGTILRNSVIAEPIVGAQSVIDNVAVVSTRASGFPCVIFLSPGTNSGLTGATVSNVYFYPYDNCTLCGITVNTWPQETGKTFYIDDIFVSNVYVRSGSIAGSFRFGFKNDQDHAKLWKIGNIMFDNCNLTIDLSTTNPDVDKTNMVAKKVSYEALA